MNLELMSIGLMEIWLKIEKAWKFLDGKKTYIVGALMVAQGLLNGDQLMVMNGLGFIFLRKGLSSK